MRGIIIKILAVLGLVLIVAVSVSLYRQLEKKNSIEAEIAKLRTEAEKIERENLQLQSKIAYLDSSDYKIREQKDKLGLQSPGEKLVIIRPGIQDDSRSAQEVQENNIPTFQRIPNETKWWNYFFKY